MSKRAEWEAIEDSNCDMHALRIGGAVAYANGPCRCGCGEGPRWDAGEDDGPADSLDQAKGIAEVKLREMRDALNEHFAPVLRWEGERARFLDWELEANESGYWRVDLLNEAGIRFANVGAGTDVDARRAAEAALRALGVVFRTEGAQ